VEGSDLTVSGMSHTPATTPTTTYREAVEREKVAVESRSVHFLVSSARLVDRGLCDIWDQLGRDPRLTHPDI